MSATSAQQAYASALADQQAALKALATAEQVVSKSEDRLEQAEQVYLDALGAPALGTRLPFEGKRILEVAQRELVRSPQKNARPTWRVGGYLYEAKDGHWIKVQRFEFLKQAQVNTPSPAAQAEQVRAMLLASKARAHRRAANALRLGANELDFLHCMKFDQGSSLRAPTGIVFGKSGSLRGNLKIVENLRRKGVLIVPNHETKSSGFIPPWYFEPMKPGPRAAEAKVLLASTPSIFGA